MLGTSDCAGRIRPAVPQATERQSTGNQIDFAMIFARGTRFVKVEISRRTVEAQSDAKAFRCAAGREADRVFGTGSGQLNGSMLLPFCKSERNSFSGDRVAALDSGQRIAKRIHF